MEFAKRSTRVPADRVELQQVVIKPGDEWH